MLLRKLRLTVLVAALLAASAAPGFAQTTVYVTGNTSFTVNWQGSKQDSNGQTVLLLGTAKFTVSNWTGTSFVMTVTNVANTMPASPDINARLTAFGFGLTPNGTFTNLAAGSVYQWAFTNFPAFQLVDVCLTSGGGCAGGGSGGLNQGQSTNDSHSLTISGNFTSGVSITPIPAKFQTSIGSLETDGVVITPPPPPVLTDLTIAKTHGSVVVVPGATVTYSLTVSNVGNNPSSGTVTVTETPPAGLTVTALAGAGWTCTVSTRTCTRSDPVAPGGSYPSITVTASVATNATPGTMTNTAAVSGGGDSNPTNNTDSDPTVISSPLPGMDLTITKTHTPNTVVPGQTFSYFVTVSNMGTAASSGTVTVTETPPTGITVTALSGAGWTCTVSTRTCTRGDALASGVSYPTITVTASVGANVTPGTLTNTAVVAGGGDPNNANNTASDPTVVSAPVLGSDLTVTKTQTTAGVITPGQVVTFTIKVMNIGDSPTTGTVTVTEAPPPALTVTALSGSGWTCFVLTLTCIRSDALAPTLSYPDITVTATVAQTATGTITNRGVVSGGGDSNPSNNTGSGPISVGPVPVPVMPLSFELGLMAALLAIALAALYSRRFRSTGGDRTP
jgi:uncharacterized repeat protein (TIGR01451 family)